MTSMGNDRVLEILKHCFLRADNIKIISNQKEDGERHYTSDIARFTVEYDQDGVTQRKHVAMKLPTSTSMFYVAESFNAYDREISMYEKVIPLMNKYLVRSLAPAHFYTTKSRILVLEDLTTRGYKSGEKLALLDLCTAKAVMKAIAHFHAASHKLYEENANILTNLLTAYMTAMFFEKLVDVWGAAALELLKRKNETKLLSKVEPAIFFFKKGEQIKTILDKSNFKFVVLNHGDCRKDNSFFKDATNNQVKVQFIDFQCSFWSSPAFDIIYFLTNSVSANVLEAHSDDLIDEYLDELSKELRRLGCASTYERVDFDEDFKTLKFYLFFSFLTLCAVVSPLNQEQAGDSIVSTITDASYAELCLNNEEFQHVVYGWLKYFEKSKMFHEF